MEAPRFKRVSYYLRYKLRIHRIRELRHFSSAQSVVPSTLFVVNDDCIIIIIYILIHLFRMCALICFDHFLYTYTNMYEYDRYSYVHLSSNGNHTMWRRAVQSMYRCFISRLPRIPFWISFIIMHTAYTINCLRPPISTIHSLMPSYLSWQFISFRCSAHSIGGPFPSSFWRTVLFDTPKVFGLLDWAVCTAHSRLWFR